MASWTCSMARTFKASANLLDDRRPRRVAQAVQAFHQRQILLAQRPAEHGMSCIHGPSQCARQVAALQVVAEEQGSEEVACTMGRQVEARDGGGIAQTLGARSE